MFLSNLWKLLAALAVAVSLAACSSSKAPAEAAMKAAEEAVAQAKSAAAKFAPDQVASLDSALASAKDKFTKGDYKAALADAQAIPAKAKDVLAAAEAKKAELTKQWTDLSEGLPKMVDAIKSRVDILSQAKKLPANVTADALNTAKTNLAEVTDGWTKAQESFKAGDVGAAVASASGLKDKAVKALEALNMPVPEAAKKS
jgi:predicted  nucleic acid-binding Zn-ribbon protein